MNILLFFWQFRDNDIKNNPEYRQEFESAVTFLLRKKYLSIDGNIETVLNNKARKLEYSRADEFKEDLKEYIRKEWKIGKTFNVDGSNKDILQQDIDYMINRL